MSAENQRPEICGECKNFERVRENIFKPHFYGFNEVGICYACDEVTCYKHTPPRDCVFGRWWEQ